MFDRVSQSVGTRLVGDCNRDATGRLLVRGGSDGVLRIPLKAESRLRVETGGAGLEIFAVRVS